MPYLRLSQRIAGLVSTQHHTTSPCFAIKRKVKTRLGSCGVGPDPVIESQYHFWTSRPALPRLSHRTSGSFSGEELQFARKPFVSLFPRVFQSCEAAGRAVELCGEDSLKLSINQHSKLLRLCHKRSEQTQAEGRAAGPRHGVFGRGWEGPGLPGERI